MASGKVFFSRNFVLSLQRMKKRTLGNVAFHYIEKFFFNLVYEKARRWLRLSYFRTFCTF